MATETSRKDIVEWMHHSILQAREAHAAAKKTGRGDVRSLAYEIRAMEGALQAAQRGDAFTAAQKIWWAHMVDHARLEVRRYAGEMDEETFQAEARGLLKARATALRVDRR